ncbi:MAG: hypothetical protein AB1407_12570, partial [Spirochaetota bacterium]
PESTGGDARCEDMATYSRLFAESGKTAGEFAASMGISRTTLWRRIKEERILAKPARGGAPH